MMPLRQLDYLVAKHVMGLHPKIRAMDITEHIYLIDGKLIPHYSSKIEAAWEVVEKMKEKYLIRIEICAEQTYCVICSKNDDWRFPCVYKDIPAGIGLSDIAAHAICLAALEAVGIKV